MKSLIKLIWFIGYAPRYVLAVARVHYYRWRFFK